MAHQFVSPTLFASSARDAFRSIRSYLAGRFLGATRDEALLQEILKCLFCKLLLEDSSPIDARETDVVHLARAVRTAFAEVKTLLPVLFQPTDEILLDPLSLQYVFESLRDIDLHSRLYDPFGDVYEVFTGSGHRGQEGQFFTPQNAVSFLVEAIDPQPGERIIDPACGSGAFLSTALRHLINKGHKPEQAAASIYGVDKDEYLARLAMARLALTTLTPPHIIAADSLALWESSGDSEFLNNGLESFDVVLANPPFGTKIISTSKEVQATFALGHKWKQDRATHRFAQTGVLLPNVPPQVLFIERLLSLARPGGRLGIVIPESLISSVNYRYVVQYLQDHSEVKLIAGMPESLFKTSGKGGTHTKTSLLVLEKKAARNESRNAIFMADAKWCGRDSRGKDIDRDDLPEIQERWKKTLRGEKFAASRLGYLVPPEQIVEGTLAPRYYGFDIDSELSALEETHELLPIGDLCDIGLLEIATGDEVGKMQYGSGYIPFIRTSDLSNWEIKIDPKHSISEDVYRRFAAKQDVQEGDILMVRDGTYLIGTCAFVSAYDTRIVYQSHIYKIRSTDHQRLSPYLLLAALSSEPVTKQIKARSYSQDIIDTLGNRILDIVLPIPKDRTRRDQISAIVSKVIQERIEARELARRATLEIAQPYPTPASA